MSEQFTYAVNECERLKATITDEASFDSNYETIVKNIIPTINAQCKSYEKTSEHAVKIDAIEEIIRETDFEPYKLKIKNDFSSKSIPAHFTPLKYSPPKLSSSVSLRPFDIDMINQVYIRIGEDVRKYTKSVMQFNEYCDSYLQAISSFEMEMVDYRRGLVSSMRKLIPSIVNEFEVHLFNVRESMRNHEEVETEYHFANGTTCEFGKSLTEFVENVFRHVLSI